MDKIPPTRQYKTSNPQPSPIRPTHDNEGTHPPIAPVNENGPEPKAPPGFIFYICDCCGGQILKPVSTTQGQSDGTLQPTPLPKPVDPNQPQKNMNLTAPQPTGKENQPPAKNPPTTLNHAEPAPTGTMKSSNTPPMPTTTTPGQPNQSTGGFFTKILAQDLQQAAQTQPKSASVGQSSAQKSTPHSMSQTASNGSLAQPSSAPTGQTASYGSLVPSSNAPTGQTASNGSLAPSSNAPINQPHSTFANNMAQLAQQLPNINLSSLSSLQTTPQGATTALQLTNTLLQMPPHTAMPMATAINQLPPLVLSNLTNLMNSLPQSFSASNTVMVTTMMANLAQQVSPKMLSSIMTTLQDLGSNPAFKSIVNDPNKLAMMQALFMSAAGKELSQQDLLKLIGPLLKTAIGENDETTKKDKKTKQAAKERIIQFLDIYVSTAHAIWAEQMNLDKRKHQLKFLHKKAKQQFNRQQLLLKNGKLREEHHVTS